MPEAGRLRSLQRRVLGINAWAVSVALTMGITGALWVEETEHRQELDVHLQELAQAIVGITEQSIHLIDAPATPLPKGGLTFQVWQRDGMLLLHTNDPANQQPLLPPNQLGFENGIVKGVDGRKYAMHSLDGRFLIQVEEPIEDRSSEFLSLMTYFWLPVALPLLFSVFATWSMQRRSAKALDTLVKRLHNRDVFDPKPMKFPNSASDIEPVIDEVNSLFQRTNNAILTEQRFTAMAAHELRTPWAGIKAQAQIAQIATTDAELQEALRALIGGINRASHVFDQLFDLARMESLEHDLSSRFGDVQLTTIFQQVMNELESRVTAKQITMATQFAEAQIRGLDFAIYLLLRNLLANAVLYTPAGGRIEVSTQKTDKGLVLCVDDSGEGIPAHARQAAFERFNRLNRSGPDGVGLGLSIVMQIIKIHGALIELQESHLGGLRAQITFLSYA